MFELDDAKRDELVDKWAEKIVGRGLSMPAIFMLEAHKPVAGIASHAAIAFQPLVAVISKFDMAQFAAFIRSPGNIERLERRIEELEARNQAREKAAKKRRKEALRRAKRIKRIRLRRLREEGDQSGSAP